VALRAMFGQSDFSLPIKEIKADYMTTKRLNATKSNGEKCDISKKINKVKVKR